MVISDLEEGRLDHSQEEMVWKKKKIDVKEIEGRGHRN